MPALCFADPASWLQQGKPCTNERCECSVNINTNDVNNVQFSNQISAKKTAWALACKPVTSDQLVNIKLVDCRPTLL